MNDSVPMLVWQLVRATVFLSLAAGVTLTAFRFLNTQSPRTRTLSWSMVLLAGVLLVPTTVSVPWYDAAPAVSQTATRPATMPSVYSTTLPRSGEASTSESAAPPIVKSPVQQTASSPNPWRHLIPTLWALGLAVILVTAVVSYSGLLISLAACWNPQRSWQREYDEAADDLGIKHPPKMIVHSHLGPFLCLTPCGYRLVIPSRQWSRLSRDERAVVLRHELAHLQRGDVWRWIPMRCIVLLHWFNPLAWMAVHRIEEVAEWEADRIALHKGRGDAGSLARALLKLARHSAQSRLLASAVSGRSLKRRLENLVNDFDRKGTEPMLKKMTLFSLLAAVLIAGAVQVRLVAQEAEQDDHSESSQVTIDTAREFAAKLVGDDELTKQLRTALNSEPGALVLRDRAGYYDQQSRQAMRSDMIATVFDSWFTKTDRGLELKTGQETFRDEFLTSADAFNQDIETTLKACRDMAGKMNPESELDRLAHRFLTDERAPVVLYAAELRHSLRPGAQMLEEVFEGIFALRRDGQYEIRADARPKAEEMAKNFDSRVQLLKTLQQYIAEFAEEIAEVDDLHQDVRTALKDPTFVTQLAAEIFESDRVHASSVDDIMEGLEDGFRDAADGLVVRDEAREEIQEHLAARDSVQAAATSLRGPLDEFADKVSDHDDVHRIWKTMLKSDLALIRVASELEYASADADEAARVFMQQILVEDDNGRLHVNPPEIEKEEVAEHISEMFRRARSAKRKGRELDRRAAEVLDPSVKAVLLTAGGKLAFADHLKRLLAAQTTDGFAEWISNHFDETADGYIIRDDQQEAIADVIAQVAEVRKELANADF